jgi:hypothetical protein
MLYRAHHPACDFFGQLRTLNSNDPADSAHSSLLYRGTQLEFHRYLRIVVCTAARELVP